LAQLLELSFDPRSPPEAAGEDTFAPFRTVYLQLRSRLQAHILSESEPCFSLSVRPIEAFNWDPQLNQEGVQEAEVGY
jgi:hypothetical protein